MKYTITKEQWLKAGERASWIKKFAQEIDKNDDEVLSAWIMNQPDLKQMAERLVPAGHLGDLDSALYRKFISDNRDVLAGKINAYINSK